LVGRGAFVTALGMPIHLASKPHPSHQAGDVIAGRYTLASKLGEGAMGVIWSAHCRALDIDVALKMLRPELAGTPAVERMAREARTAAQLGHPALVRVLDFGSSERGEPFLAMELLEGEELNARLARDQRISAVEAIGLLLPVIEGLAIAHQKGIVHRDVKPENIFISVDQLGRVQPKVLDFGVAKLGSDGVSKLTDGAVVGSPHYLSPEQAEGLEDIDHRADVWAIGVVLYECITGLPPFTGRNYNVLLQSILRDSPAPITSPAPADAALWLVIERCLKKDRAQRWESMWELGEALALWLFERGVRVDAAARSLRHGWLESGFSGVKVIVASEAPEAPLLRPRSAPEPQQLDADAIVPMSKAFTLPVAPVEQPSGPSRLWWWGGLSLLLGGVVAFALWAHLAPVAPARPAEPHAVSEPSALAPLGLGAMEQTVPPSLIPRVMPMPEPAASAAASVPPAAAKTPKTKRVPAKRAPSQRPSREFGF
jgi:serine/threonine-protein kinase